MSAGVNTVVQIMRLHLDKSSEEHSTGSSVCFTAISGPQGGESGLLKAGYSSRIMRYSSGLLCSLTSFSNLHAKRSARINVICMTNIVSYMFDPALFLLIDAWCV